MNLSNIFFSLCCYTAIEFYLDVLMVQVLRYLIGCDLSSQCESGVNDLIKDI